MILLVNCVVSSLVKLGLDTPVLGSLVNPRRWDTEEKLAGHNLVFAADNDAFSGFHFDRYVDMLQMLKRWERKPAWVTLPDVVSDYLKTEELARKWVDVLRGLFGLRPAYVIQDGQTIWNIDWGLVDALFVGGSTEYKLGPDARLLVYAAKSRGLWVHMGRVNSKKRMSYARMIGCDSVDGSSFNMYRDRHLPWAVEHLEKGELWL